MTPAVGFLTRALRGVKGQAKKLSLFDPDPQLMTMATLTDNASLVVGDGDRIIAKNTQWLTDVPEATDEEGSNEADDASPITSPLDPAASLHQSVGSIYSTRPRLTKGAGGRRGGGHHHTLWTQSPAWVWGPRQERMCQGCRHHFQGGGMGEDWEHVRDQCHQEGALGLRG